MAMVMLTMAGDTETLRKKWILHLMKQNPRIASLIGKPIDSARIWGAQQHYILEFYKRFDAILARHNTHQVDIWNMDEHVIALDVSTNSVVLEASEKRQTYI